MVFDRFCDFGFSDHDFACSGWNPHMKNSVFEKYPKNPDFDVFRPSVGSYLWRAKTGHFGVPQNHWFWTLFGPLFEHLLTLPNHYHYIKASSLTLLPTTLHSGQIPVKKWSKSGQKPVILAKNREFHDFLIVFAILCFRTMIFHVPDKILIWKTAFLRNTPKTVILTLS